MVGEQGRKRALGPDASTPAATRLQTTMGQTQQGMRPAPEYSDGDGVAHVHGQGQHTDTADAEHGQGQTTDIISHDLHGHGQLEEDLDLEEHAPYDEALSEDQEEHVAPPEAHETQAPQRGGNRIIYNHPLPRALTEEEITPLLSLENVLDMFNDVHANAMHLTYKRTVVIPPDGSVCNTWMDEWNDTMLMWHNLCLTRPALTPDMVLTIAQLAGYLDEHPSVVAAENLLPFVLVPGSFKQTIPKPAPVYKNVMDFFPNLTSTRQELLECLMLSDAVGELYAKQRVKYERVCLLSGRMPTSATMNWSDDPAATAARKTQGPPALSQGLPTMQGRAAPPVGTGAIPLHNRWDALEGTDVIMLDQQASMRDYPPLTPPQDVNRTPGRDSQGTPSQRASEKTRETGAYAELPTPGNEDSADEYLSRGLPKGTDAIWKSLRATEKPFTGRDVQITFQKWLKKYRLSCKSHALTDPQIWRMAREFMPEVVQDTVKRTVMDDAFKGLTLSGWTHLVTSRVGGANATRIAERELHEFQANPDDSITTFCDRHQYLAELAQMRSGFTARGMSPNAVFDCFSKAVHQNLNNLPKCVGHRRDDWVAAELALIATHEVSSPDANDTEVERAVPTGLPELGKDTEAP